MAGTQTTIDAALDQDTAIFWDNIARNTAEGWRGVLRAMTCMTLEALDSPTTDPALAARIDALLARVRAFDAELAADLDEAFADTDIHAEKVGAQLGYSIARTQPAALDAMPTWPARAARFFRDGEGGESA